MPDGTCYWCKGEFRPVEEEDPDSKMHKACEEEMKREDTE